MQLPTYKKIQDDRNHLVLSFPYVVENMRIFQIIYDAVDMGPECAFFRI